LPGRHRLDQAAHHPEVVRVAGQVGAADQDSRVGPPAGVQAPQRDPQRRRPVREIGLFQPFGLGQQDGPRPQPRHSGLDDLPVQRVGQAHLLVGDGDRHQPGPFQRLQHPGSRGGLEVAELERLAQGEQIDHGTGLRGKAPDPLLDQVEQPARGGQPVLQVPYA
jgi:hypothetical protein